MAQKPERLRAELAVLPANDPVAGDAPGTVVTVRCSALTAAASRQPSAVIAVPSEGMRTASDSKHAAGGDWCTATLRFGEAYPAESPCVEFSSSAAGFSSRQVIVGADLTLRCLIKVMSNP